MRALPLLSIAVLSSAVLSSALAWPALAASSGPPHDRFASTWTAPSASAFVPGVVANVAIGPTSLADDDEALLTEARMSASNDAFRRDLAIDEMTGPWQPAQRAALEGLREAQRRWVAAAGGDVAARDARFVALLHDVAEGRGRSAAPEAAGADGALDAAYTQALRQLPDDKLAALDGSERAWTAYRDAFAGFAAAMDHPDAETAVREQLTRQRAQELRAMAEQR